MLCKIKISVLYFDGFLVVLNFVIFTRTVLFLSGYNKTINGLQNMMSGVSTGCTNLRATCVTVLTFFTFLILIFA